MAQPSETAPPFEIKFTSREVSAWGGMALMKRMLDSMDFRAAVSRWDLPEPGSNRGYPPVQLIEQLLVSIWCGACRFTHLDITHLDITRLDSTLTRLFGWTRVAGHKAIVRLFGRFDMMRHEQVQASVYRWFFDAICTLPSLTVDMDSTVITRHGNQQGAARGYNPNKAGGYRPTRYWPSWPKRAWPPTSGCVRAMPTAPTTCCNSSNPPCII